MTSNSLSHIVCSSEFQRFVNKTATLVFSLSKKKFPQSNHFAHVVTHKGSSVKNCGINLHITDLDTWFSAVVTIFPLSGNALIIRGKFFMAHHNPNL